MHANAETIDHHLRLLSTRARTHGIHSLRKRHLDAVKRDQKEIGIKGRMSCIQTIAQALTCIWERVCKM